MSDNTPSFHDDQGADVTERATYDAPVYTVTTKIDDRPVGGVMQPIPDPFIHTTVTVGRRDLWRSLLRGRLTVSVQVSGDSRTITRVLEMDPDYLGPAGSPSRKAWDAAIQERLEAL